MDYDETPPPADWKCFHCSRRLLRGDVAHDCYGAHGWRQFRVLRLHSDGRWEFVQTITTGSPGDACVAVLRRPDMPDDAHLQAFAPLDLHAKRTGTSFRGAGTPSF